jgi:hypothetical protein
MVETICIKLDDKKANFVKEAKERSGETWSTWIVTAAEALNNMNHVKEKLNRENFKMAKRQVEEKLDRIDAYNANYESVTGKIILDSPWWEDYPSSNDIARLESEIPGESGTFEMRLKISAVIFMWDFLRLAGKADKNAMMDAAAARIDATDYADRESFWTNVVDGRETLSGFDGVRKPPEGREMWEFVES